MRRLRFLLAFVAAGGVIGLTAPGVAAGGGPPGMQIKFVSAKLLAKGAAVGLTLAIQCDFLGNDDDANTDGGFDFNPQGMLNASVSQAINKTTTTQGFGNGNFQPDQIDSAGAPFCDGSGFVSTLNDSGGTGADWRDVYLVIQPGGNGPSTAAPFKLGSALLGNAGGQQCNGGFSFGNQNQGPSCNNDSQTDGSGGLGDADDLQEGGGLNQPVVIKITR